MILFTERTIIVSEFIGKPLCECQSLEPQVVLRIFYQIAAGLAHIHKCGFVMKNLEPKHILVDELDNVKLFNYGMFYQTNGGEYVTFPIGYCYHDLNTMAMIEFVSK